MANKFLNVLSNDINITNNKLSFNLASLNLNSNTKYSIVNSENSIKNPYNDSVELPEFNFTTSSGDNPGSGDDPSSGSEPAINITTLEFTTATAGNNRNFFDKSGQASIDTSNYIVNINGTDTDQTITALTFVANDKIIIKKKDDVEYFPVLNCNYKNNIKSIDAPLPLMSLNFTNDTVNFNECFRGCSNLTSIPADLFRYNTSATSFYNCFYKCSGLTSIPEDLFKYNINVTSFYSSFAECTSLTSVPANLFKYNTAATNFSHCFEKCSGLISISEDLFKYNTSVTDFSYCFQNCSNVTSIPANIFGYNTAVIDLLHCFYNCSSVTSALPELWVSHSSASHSGCFYNCTNASNYSDAQTAGWV